MDNYKRSWRTFCVKFLGKNPNGSTPSAHNQRIALKLMLLFWLFLSTTLQLSLHPSLCSSPVLLTIYRNRQVYTEGTPLFSDNK